MKKTVYYNQAKTELLNQTEVISRQFHKLIENDYSARTVSESRLISEVKALSFVLETYDTIRDANPFLEDIVNTTELKNLWIYDRNGNVLFKSGEDPVNPIRPDDIDIADFLDHRQYETIEQPYKYIGDEDRYMYITYTAQDENGSMLWGVGNRWLIYVENVFSETQKAIENYFDWNAALQGITVGRTGSVLVIDNIDGKVISSQDPSMKGTPVKDLNIRIAGESTYASAEQLLEEFEQPDTINEILVDGIRYYAARLDLDYDLFLAMLPAQEVEEEGLNEALILMILLTLITGIGVLYAFSLINTEKKHPETQNEKTIRLKIPTGKLKVFTMLAVVLMFVISLYLEMLFLYSQMFRYTSTTVNEVLQKTNTTDQILNEIQSWSGQDALKKCKIASSAIQYSDQKLVNRQYLSDLADCLNIRYLYVYDDQGLISLTNASYDGFTISSGSPFHALLEGTSSMIL